METLITTYGRPLKQVTLKMVPDAKLVIQARERERYRRYPDEQLVVLPENIVTLSPTRQWIAENFIIATRVATQPAQLSVLEPWLPWFVLS